MSNLVVNPIPLWPHQAFALEEIPRRIGAGERRILLTSPTGGGNSRVVCELIKLYLQRGWASVVYTNRRLLIEQLTRVLTGHGIEFGVRASGHADNRHLPVQISSLPTERSRVLDLQKWDIHGNGHGGKVLALVDEAHSMGPPPPRPSWAATTMPAGSMSVLQLHRSAWDIFTNP